LRLWPVNPEAADSGGPKGQALQARNARRTIKSVMQPLLENCVAPHHPDCRAEPIQIVALHEPLVLPLMGMSSILLGHQSQVTAGLSWNLKSDVKLPFSGHAEGTAGHRILPDCSSRKLAAG
jgi:hypothetical protein